MVGMGAREKITVRVHARRCDAIDYDSRLWLSF